MKIRRRLTRQGRTIFRKKCFPIKKKDLNQAEDASPLGFSPPPDLQSQKQHVGETERK